MSLKMGGYICDMCRVIIIEPNDGRMLYKAMANLLQNTNLTLRIYCPNCGEIVKRAEHTMRLEGSKNREGTI